MSETQKPISGTPHRDKSDEGYRKGLKSRHMRMIALAGPSGPACFMVHLDVSLTGDRQLLLFTQSVGG